MQMANPRPERDRPPAPSLDDQRWAHGLRARTSAERSPERLEAARRADTIASSTTHGARRATTRSRRSASPANYKMARAVSFTCERAGTNPATGPLPAATRSRAGRRCPTASTPTSMPTATRWCILIPVGSVWGRSRGCVSLNP